MDSKRESTLYVLSQKGLLLQHFHDFQDDKEAVLISINQNPESYKYASPELQKDKEVQLALIKNSVALYHSFHLT
jgi:hypothetical protein